MAEEIFIETPDKTYIRAVFSRPADVLAHRFNKSLIIALHDFPGNCDGAEGIFLHLQELFHEKRHAMLRFDFHGCGKSDGQSVDFTLSTANKDLQTILKWADLQGYQHITLLAEGLAPLLLDYESLPKSVKTIVLLWPALDPQEYAERYFKAKAHEAQITAQGYFNFKNTSIGKKFITAIQELDPLRIARQIKLPTLAFHGKEDQIVPISCLNVVRDHLGARRIDITTFDDGTHGLPLPNHREAIAQHILHFIEKFSLK